MFNSPIEEIKDRLDIVEVIRGYIKLQKAGANYRALCPFHNEKKPSFFVSPSRQIWHCFGACSEGGDIFKFIMKIEGVEFGDALRILAQKAGVELKRQDPKLKTERQRLYEILELSCRFFEKQLEASPTGREAKEYLLKRGVKEETIKKWRLGYAPDAWQGLSDFLVSRGYKREEIERAGLALKSEKTGNYFDRFRARITFPIFDLSSQIIGFGGRVFKNEDTAKYINSPNTLLYDKSRILYGLNKAGVSIRKKDFCVLVEGYMDVILAHQTGFENVVATSGTALTQRQLSILKRYSENLLTAFDMDLAGDSATKRGIDLAQSHGFNIKVITMPEEKDPADVISENPKTWQNLLQEATTIHDFYFNNALAQFDKDTLEGKKGISRILLPVIKRIPNKIEQSHWVKNLADVLQAREEDVLAELSKIKIDDFSKQTFEQIIVSPPKSRKELLEERLIMLMIKFPEKLSLIKEEDFQIFSCRTLEIINCLKQKKKNSQIDYFSLKAETGQFNFESKEEFECYLSEIRNLMLKNKLDNISKEIKRAEEEKDFARANQLFKEFHNLCRRKEA